MTELQAGQSSSGSTTIVGVDRLDGLKRLLEKQEEEVDAISKKIELYTHYKDDYIGLKKLIDRMQDRVRFPHRIPIAGTNLAYVDGHIIHTNELHVLLGDNYFALRSAKQATQVIDRRLKGIEEQLKLCEAAKKKAAEWLKITDEHKREKEKFVEIIETM